LKKTEQNEPTKLVEDLITLFWY